MKFKTLALATTSLVALGLTVATATAAPTPMMGDVMLGGGFSWNNYDFESSSFDRNYSYILGQGRVNLPYSDTVNIQLDAVSRASMDEIFGNKAQHFALGAHINYRDDQGLLGVFAGAGRVQDFFISSPVFLAGIEGQYFCHEWTLSGRAGYMDSQRDSWMMANAGFVQVGTSYYASKKLKLTGSVAYIDGEQDFGSSNNPDAREWAWTLGAHYWFGVSMPVSAFIEYSGRNAETNWGGEGSATNNENMVNAGVVFHFGGDGFQDADRNGASVDLPDLNWYRLGTGSL